MQVTLHATERLITHRNIKSYPLPSWTDELELHSVTEGPTASHIQTPNLVNESAEC